MWLSFERTRFHTLTGNFRLRHSFHSRYLTAARDIIVCLPPDYDADAPVAVPCFIWSGNAHCEFFLLYYAS